jgi:FkbM family methyltransferase
VNGLETLIASLPDATYTRDATTVIEKRGLHFCVRTQTMDAGIIDEVYQEYLQWLANKVAPDSTIVDIGAHIGAFSTQIAQLLSDRARIFSFEPEPGNFQLLQQNIELNGLTQVRSFNQAVADKPGTAKLFLSSDNTGGHRLHLPDPSAQKSVTVTVTTLPEILVMSGPIDVLKVDVEGSEHSVLMPFGPLLIDSVKHLIVEAGGSAKGDGNTLLTFLKNLGFVCESQGDPSLMLIRAYNPKLVTSETAA